MRLRLNRVLAPLTVLGPGRRVGVWVQGCTLACVGCASTDTWPAAGGVVSRSAEVAEHVLTLVAEHDLTGVTISGGEPFQQAAAVADLLRRVRAARDDLDVLVFTGYTSRAAARRSPDLLAAADVVIAGPYRAHVPGAGSMRASGNQELLVRTELGRRRFADELPGASGPGARPRMQVAATGGDLYLAGLPAPGDLDRLAAELRRRGVALGQVSWQP